VINSAGMPIGGVWVAYYDGSLPFLVFETEVEAYRYALPRSMKVTFLPYGVDILDHEKAQREAGS
jgi:hypothetical protein